MVLLFGIIVLVEGKDRQGLGSTKIFELKADSKNEKTNIEILAFPHSTNATHPYSTAIQRQSGSGCLNPLPFFYL